MTRLEREIEKQRAIAESQRGFMAEISKMLLAERVRLEEVEHGYAEGEVQGEERD